MHSRIKRNYYTHTVKKKFGEETKEKEKDRVVVRVNRAYTLTGSLVYLYTYFPPSFVVDRRRSRERATVEAAGEKKLTTKEKKESNTESWYQLWYAKRTTR